MAVLLLLNSTGLSAEDAPKTVNGRVVDEMGCPVRDADVSAFWSANGLSWDQVRTLPNDQPEAWTQNEGKMVPWADPRVTDADGRFSLPVRADKNRLLASDRERRRGAVILFDPKHPEQPVEAQLRPLVRVLGTIRLAGAETPMKLWSSTYLNIPYYENEPLNRRRMATCGSFKGRFELLVPPGTYEISASNAEPHAATVEDRKFTVMAGQKELDLGHLVLRPIIGVQDRIDRAKAQGTWGNYKENYGKQAPRWHLTDAKGVDRDAQLSDFRGKWVVLYFWSPNCAPCLGKQLPELMVFHDAHKTQHHRYEILAFCCDFSETLKDIRDLERQLEPVKKAVWAGRDLPFPVLLDNTFRTYERFGLEGTGVSNLLLIDPDGKLVEGDLKALSEKLGHASGPRSGVGEAPSEGATPHEDRR
jgi:peroxiredoxin